MTPPPEPPRDPISALQEAAAGLHELYREYVRAGFTETQSLYLCAQVLRGAITPGETS
jgi:hypothetical protein